MPNFFCCKCSRGNCKLWRYANTSCVELHCIECVVIEEGCPFPRLRKNGCYKTEEGVLTDSIGDFVPAIPHPEGGWYQHCSCTRKAGRVWQKLPNFPLKIGSLS